jgi:hypothetical protein
MGPGFDGVVPFAVEVVTMETSVSTNPFFLVSTESKIRDEEADDGLIYTGPSRRLKEPRG